MYEFVLDLGYIFDFKMEEIRTYREAEHFEPSEYLNLAKQALLRCIGFNSEGDFWRQIGNPVQAILIEELGYEPSLTPTASSPGIFRCNELMSAMQNYFSFASKFPVSED